MTDNLPPEFGGPHVVYFPADHALMLRIASDKEIVALRDEINKKLDQIKEDLKAEERGVYKTRSDSRDRTALTPAQAQEVKELQKDNTDTEKNLKDLAKAAETAPSFQPLADLARDVAAKEMKESEKALNKASEDHKTPAEREAQFQNSEKQLDLALSRLEQMRQKNEELAQKALAGLNLTKLAEQEKTLAEKAADLAAKDPVKDPSAKDEAEKIKQEQQKTTDELQKLTEQNPELRKELEEARAEEARDLSQRAKELAQEQRDLAKAQAETEKRQNEERLAELAKKQQELADKASELAKETKEPTQAAKTNPLKPEDAQKAADALKQGDAAEALKHQDQRRRIWTAWPTSWPRPSTWRRTPRRRPASWPGWRTASSSGAGRSEEAKRSAAAGGAREAVEAEQKAIAQAAERLSAAAGQQGRPAGQATSGGARRQGRRGAEAEEPVVGRQPGGAGQAGPGTPGRQAADAGSAEASRRCARSPSCASSRTRSPRRRSRRPNKPTTPIRTIPRRRTSSPRS